MRDMLDRIMKKRLHKLPKHVAVTADRFASIKEIREKGLEKSCLDRDKALFMLIEEQVSLNIPVMSFLLLREARPIEEINSLSRLFRKLLSDDTVKDSRIKVSVLGKWYDLPGPVVEDIKALIDETKEHDSFFLNLCVNYNGQEEIVDACKLICRKIEAGRIEVDSVNRELIKESLYSSHLLAPELVIRTGAEKSSSDLLLWDISDAVLFFPEKRFNELTASDFKLALKGFERYSLTDQDTSGHENLNL